MKFQKWKTISHTFNQGKLHLSRKLFFLPGMPPEKDTFRFKPGLTYYIINGKVYQLLSFLVVEDDLQEQDKLYNTLYWRGGHGAAPDLHFIRRLRKSIPASEWSLSNPDHVFYWQRSNSNANYVYQLLDSPIGYRPGEFTPEMLRDKYKKYLARLAKPKAPRKRPTTPIHREAWRGLDYWLWCLFTLDDEETRLQEEPDVVVSDFLKAGGPKSQVPRIRQLIQSITRSDSSTDKLFDLFKPYASHQDLLKAGTWEERYNKKLGQE